MSSEPRGTILLVDDEEIQLNIGQAVLEQAGFVVVTATSGPAALEVLAKRPFDAVITDLTMTGMDGIELIRSVRRVDLDLPIIIVTAAPSLDSAIRAVEYGAMRYLLKPVKHDELAAVAARAVQLRKMAELKRQAIAISGDSAREIGDRAGLESTFSSALETLHVHYQPIVDFRARRIFAYEALARSREPRMPHPGVLFDAAERLGRLQDIGRRIRVSAPRCFETDRGDALLFVNLHPTDLTDEALFEAASPLGNAARRVVLEITERASLDEVKDVRARIARLRALGYRIALDDLGAGYAGLTAFSLLEPDVAKLDMSLVRDVHRSTTKQALIRSMARLCDEMKIVLVTEGVESTEERDALVELGCNLFQGYLFARPAEVPPSVDWH